MAGAAWCEDHWRSEGEGVCMRIRVSLTEDDFRALVAGRVAKPIPWTSGAPVGWGEGVIVEIALYKTSVGTGCSTL